MALRTYVHLFSFADYKHHTINLGNSKYNPIETLVCIVKLLSIENVNLQTKSS